VRDCRTDLGCNTFPSRFDSRARNQTFEGGPNMVCRSPINRTDARTWTFPNNPLEPGEFDRVHGKGPDTSGHPTTVHATFEVVCKFVQSGNALAERWVRRRLQSMCNSNSAMTQTNYEWHKCGPFTSSIMPSMLDGHGQMVSQRRGLSSRCSHGARICTNTDDGLLAHRCITNLFFVLVISATRMASLCFI
jgi:hypothetical protein